MYKEKTDLVLFVVSELFLREFFYDTRMINEVLAYRILTSSRLIHKR